MIKTLRDRLESRGFRVSDPELEGFVSFDLIARRDSERYILKVLQNVDTFKSINAGEIIRLARMTSSAAIVIGGRGGSGSLQRGVVYYRHHVPILSLKTYLDYIDGDVPYVYSGPGGFYIPIDGEAMRSAREEMGFSIGFVSNKIGTSRRSISLYESGNAATVDIFLKLENLLLRDIRRRLDMLNVRSEAPITSPAEFANSFIEEVFNIMMRGGYDFQSVKKSPFDAIAYETLETLMLVGLFEDMSSRTERAVAIRNVSEIFENIPLIISKTNTDKEHIGGCPVINLSELRHAQDKRDIVKILVKKNRYDI
ncbi:hypothetical protein IX51_00855 [uncultured archaeon]|nr:hypothetical protein IX51_00855 [uncultured archaeon]